MVFMSAPDDSCWQPRCKAYGGDILLSLIDGLISCSILQFYAGIV